MALSRRAFAAAAAASLGGGLLAVSGLRRLLAPGAAAGPIGTPGPPSAGDPTGTVREYALRAAPIEWDAGLGGTTRAWAYNGRIAGPELRVREGETLRVVLTNGLPEPTTIHWHGVPVPFGMDGVPDLTQPAVPPGATYVYEFTARAPGTYWYHTHFGYQLDRGLYGALIVEPRQEHLAYDREFTLVIDDWLADPEHPSPDPDATGMAGMMGGMGGMSGMGGMMGGMGGMMGGSKGSHLTGAPRVQPRYDALIINGASSRTPPELSVRRGDRVRLRLVNAASAQPVAVQAMGHDMQVTHADGQPIRPVTAGVVVLGMGERLDVLVEARTPGIWPIVAFAAGGLRATALLRYEGVRGTTPEPIPDQPDARSALSYEALEALEPLPVRDPDQQHAIELSGGMMDATQWTMNGRRYPDTTPITVHPGERVRLRLSNMSMMPHPMHLHGHFLQLVGLEDRMRPRPALKDTVTLGHMGAVTVDVVADNPGAHWLFHCHNLYHMMAGMATELRYA